MLRATLSEIEKRVSGIVELSPLAAIVSRVIVEPAEDGDGDDYLRVKIGMKRFKGVHQDDMLALIHSIEDSLEGVDDRYPSVRFPKAA